MSILGHFFTSRLGSLLGVFFVVSCTLDDSDRCSGGNFEFEGGSCLELKDTSDEEGSDSESDDVNDDVNDGGIDGGETEEITGLEETCIDPEEDCKDFDASFCLKDPNEAETAEGACVIPNCSKNPDNCPEGHQCCDFPDMVDGILGVGSICVLVSAYDELEIQVMGCNG